jgi:hypothetical protein
MLQYVFLCCNCQFKILQHVLCYMASQYVTNICSWMLQAMINIWSICLSFHLSLLHVWQGAVSASAIESAAIITVLYYYITGERREPKGDERWGGTGRAKASGSKREGAQRKPLDLKGKETDQLFISRRPGASIFLCFLRDWFQSVLTLLSFVFFIIVYSFLNLFRVANAHITRREMLESFYWIFFCLLKKEVYIHTQLVMFWKILRSSRDGNCWFELWFRSRHVFSVAIPT